MLKPRPDERVPIERRPAVETWPTLCANLKGLEDEAEELEELSKLALSPVGVYSTQVSPNPSDCPEDPTTERAEEALVLIPTESNDTATAVEEPQQQQQLSATASDPPTPAKDSAVKNNGRRTSHSWRGLKKQLSRVDLRLKNTFNNASSSSSASSKKTSSATTFYGEQQQPQPAAVENEEVGLSGTGGSLPQIITEADGQDQLQQQQRPEGQSAVARPTELRLFDRDGKPIKPPRSGKDHRKRTSLDKQGGGLAAGTAVSATRDARLLSVPNIKYSQRDPRHNRSNNQAFINLIKRLSKFTTSYPPTEWKVPLILEHLQLWSTRSDILFFLIRFFYQNWVIIDIFVLSFMVMGL